MRKCGGLNKGIKIKVFKMEIKFFIESSFNNSKKSLRKR